MATLPPPGPPPANGSLRHWYIETFKTVGLPVVIVAFLLGQDAGYVPSNSRASLVIVEAILKDTNKAVAAQERWHVEVIAELRALRRRQAALCLLMMTELSKPGKDVTAIREACVAEAMGGVP